MTIRQLSDYDKDGQCLGHDASDKIAFYGAAPIPQRADAAQAALTDNSGGTASDTIAALTNIAVLTDSSGGTTDDTVEAVALSGGTPSGALNTQVAAINNNFAEVAGELIAQRALNADLINSVASLTAKANEMRATLVALGLMKGGA